MAAGVALLLLLFGRGTAGISFFCRRMGVDGLGCFDWMERWILETAAADAMYISLPTSCWGTCS